MRVVFALQMNDSVLLCICMREGSLGGGGDQKYRVVRKILPVT